MTVSIARSRSRRWAIRTFSTYLPADHTGADRESAPASSSRKSVMEGGKLGKDGKDGKGYERLGMLAEGEEAGV